MSIDTQRAEVQTPTVGQIVHYVTEGRASVHAAIVTAFYPDGTIDITAFPPFGEAPYTRQSVKRFGEFNTFQDGWKYPERV